MGRRNNRLKDMGKIVEQKKKKFELFEKREKERGKRQAESQNKTPDYLIHAVDVLSGKPAVQGLLRENYPSERLLTRLKREISPGDIACPHRKRLARLVLSAVEKQIKGSVPKREHIDSISDLADLITSRRIVPRPMEHTVY